jgi:hypothetical protein
MSIFLNPSVDTEENLENVTQDWQKRATVEMKRLHKTSEILDR